MILIYRPELDNPPMDKEAVIGFTFVEPRNPHDKNDKTVTTNYINVEAGVNREFPENVWEQIKEYAVVKRLMSLGAIRIEEDATKVEEKTEGSEPTVPADSIADFDLQKAMRLIEDSFDVDQLKRWDRKDSRIRVKNAISKRIEAITQGKG